MEKPIVRLKQGARIKSDPETVYKELERIRAKAKGAITPEAVLSAAKAKSAPLHKEFEWDDAKAGHQHRLYQARCIIGSIEVVRVEAPHIQSRAYEVDVVKAENPGEKARQVYRTTEDILQDQVSREALITRFIAEVQALRKRYAALSELALIWRAVDTVLDKIAKRDVG